MRAVVQDIYGGPGVLRIEEIERPAAGHGEVVVKVFATGLDPGVWHLMTGLPYLVRVMGYGLRRPRTRVRGTDLAGRVETVGKEVTGFFPGDEVFGTCNGAFAEYATAAADHLAPKPENLSFVQAAALPSSALTALQGLCEVGKLGSGQKVLVIGASGGVGSFAVQIAKALDAKVTGVCSTAKKDLVLSLGAERVIDYTREDVADGHRYDLILDTAGNRSLKALRSALAPEGTLVIVGGEAGGRWLGGTDRQLRALVLSPFVRQNLRAFVARTRPEDLLGLKALVEAGEISPVIDRIFPLHEVAEAIRYLEKGLHRGKIVITL